MNGGEMLVAMAIAVIAYMLGRYLIGPFSRSETGRRHLGAGEAYILPMLMPIVLMGVLLFIGGPKGTPPSMAESVTVTAIATAILGLPAVAGAYIGRRHWSRR